MNNSEKILELLEKKNLTGEEKILLQNLLKEPGNKHFAGLYKNIEETVKSSAHLSADEIADYVLVKNKMEPENKNIHGRIPFIENHLRTCIKCEDEFKMFNAEYSDAEVFLSAEMHQDKDVKEETIVRREAVRSRRKFFIPGYAFASAAVLFAAAVLFLTSYFSQPQFYDAAKIGDNQEYFVTRGRASDEFQQSLKALEEENYNEAIVNLKEDIKNNPGDETIFYSHYILGLAYLQTAENSFFGLFSSFDKTKAEQALVHFQTAVQLNNSGRYDNINLNALYYSAKANLMLGNLDLAKNELNTVVENKGGKMEEAKKILSSLE